MAGKPKYRGVVPDGQAYCSKCKRCLPVGRFGPELRKANGLSSWCRSCHAVHVRDRRATAPGGWRDYYLRETFGITEVRYQEMLAAQDGKCAICRTDVPWAKETRLVNFAVDHDHSCCPGKRSCGKCVRGLLCNRCNRGLGQFGDNLDHLRRAVAYLTTSQGG